MRILILLLCCYHALATSPIRGGVKEITPVWCHAFYEDSVETEFLIPMLVKNQVLYCSRFEPSKGSPSFAMYYQTTGEKPLQWNENPKPCLDTSLDFINDFLVMFEQQKIFIANEEALYAFNLTNAEREWKHNSPKPSIGGIRLARLGTKVLLYNLDEILAKEKGTIFAYNSDCVSAPEEIITLSAKDGYEFTFGTPTTTVNQSGDTLILFQTRAWNFELAKPRVGIYAYNTTSKAMRWEHTLFDEARDGTSFPPIVFKDSSVIIQLNGRLAALQIENGDTIWNFESPYSSTMTPAVIYKDTLLFRNDEGNLYALDPTTGKVHWQSAQKFTPATLSNIVVYKGKLYTTAFTQNGIALYCISLKNGVCEWHSYGPVGRVNGGLAINEKNGKLFCSSNTFLFCIDLETIEG